jgi:hypothetical protein
VLLAGVALSALVDGIVGVMMAAGDPRAMALLSGWKERPVNECEHRVLRYALALLQRSPRWRHAG